MAEPNEAGTSPATTPVTESGGTGAGTGNGSESAAKPIDAGLLEAWKPKVEGYNQAVAERDAAKQRIAELEARIYQAQAPANPMAQTIAQLQEEASWNPSAAASLQVLSINTSLLGLLQSFFNGEKVLVFHADHVDAKRVLLSPLQRPF